MNRPCVPRRWQAQLDMTLSYQQLPGFSGSYLADCQHQGPLRVQRTLYPEGAQCPHVYILHPPGGVVAGDEIEIRLAVTAQANGVLLTPGAGKFYNAGEQGEQRQSVHLVLAEDAALELLPYDTIAYPGAQARLDTEIQLEPSSRLIYWDSVCFGLQAQQQRFDRGYVQQRLLIREQGRPQWCDHWRLTPERLSLAGLKDNPVYGCLVMVAPWALPAQQHELAARLRQQVSALDADSVVAVSCVDRLVVVRYLGADSAQLKRVFSQLWQLARPDVIKRAPCPPGIWRT